MSRVERRISRAHAIADLRDMAKKRLPKSVFDFIEGAADDEVTFDRNRRAWNALSFSPRVMVDVAQRDLSADLLGRQTGFPMIVAPTGLSSLVWPGADVALARAAAKFDLPFVVSTASSTRLEDIARAAPDARLWLQVYVYRDRELARSLIRRARDCGFEAVVLTADVPLFGNRERDARNRFTVPVRPTPRLVFDMLRCPGWFLDILTHGVPRMENFVDPDGPPGSIGSLAAFVTSNMDASVDWSDLPHLLADWPGKTLLKGVLSAQDAALAVEAGFDGIIVSNHGGRQLDHAPSTATALPEIIAAVDGRAQVIVDSGIRRGSDIAKGLCLGATAVMTGRATLYGVAAGGQTGAERALHLLRAEFDRTLALVGCARARSLNPAYLRAPNRDRL